MTIVHAAMLGTVAVFNFFVGFQYGGSWISFTAAGACLAFSLVFFWERWK